MTQTLREAIADLTALAERLDSTADLSVERAFEQDSPALWIKNMNMRDGRGWEILSGGVQVLGDWFVWDDGDRIARTDHIGATAERVRRVLTVSELV